VPKITASRPSRLIWLSHCRRLDGAAAMTERAAAAANKMPITPSAAAG
jgi:hypothetical protein